MPQDNLDWKRCAISILDYINNKTIAFLFFFFKCMHCIIDSNSVGTYKMWDCPIVTKRIYCSTVTGWPPIVDFSSKALKYCTYKLHNSRSDKVVSIYMTYNECQNWISIVTYCHFHFIISRQLWNPLHPSLDGLASKFTPADNLPQVRLTLLWWLQSIKPSQCKREWNCPQPSNNNHYVSKRLWLIVIFLLYPRNLVEGRYIGISFSVRLSGFLSVCRAARLYVCQVVCLSMTKILSGDLLHNHWSDFVQIWHRCSLGWVVVPPKLASQGANSKGDSDRKCEQKRAFCEQLRNYWSDLVQIWHRCSLGWVVVPSKLAFPGSAYSPPTDPPLVMPT